MKQYYYANGDQQLGPFTIQELQSKNLTKDTYVWYEGLSDWTRAGDLPEMNPLFGAALGHDQPIANQNQPTVQQTPQAPVNQGGYQQPIGHHGNPQQPLGQKPKTWLVESILVTIFMTLTCCLPLGIVGIVYANQVESKWKAGDYNGAHKASDNARIWTLVSFGLIIVAIIFYVIMGVIGALDSGF